MEVDALLEGASLRVALWPNEEVTPESPPHIEGFDLPHIVSVSGDFWAKTPTVHTRGKPLVCSFAYPSRGAILCSYTPSNGTGRFIQTDRYEKREWRVVDNYYEVWDSNSWIDMEELTAAVYAGLRLKVAMLDESDVWEINPVHLPMANGGWFHLMTAMDYYPAWFRSTTWVGDIAKACAPEFAEDRYATTVFECAAYPSWYALNPDGTFRGGLSQDAQHYKRLRVFAERAHLQQ